MRHRSGLLAASAALFASAAQAQEQPQPSVTATMSSMAGVRVANAFYTQSCKPAYPPAAVRAGAEGRTSLRLTIDERGHVASAAVIASAGSTRAHKLMDAAAVAAVTDCPLFEPAVDAQDRPVGFSAEMAWRWSLHGPPAPARPARLRAVDESCRPLYPPAAVRAEAQGETTLRLMIDAAGQVKSVTVVHSAGDSAEHKLLDEAAAQALPHCPFVPGTDFEGKPIGTRIDVSYTWKLEP